MREYIKLKKSNCKHCYKCIRSCPVKSIKFSDEQAHIITDECLLCGMCFVSCPQNAKDLVDDLPEVAQAVEKYEVYASIAPSFVTMYPGATIASMRTALKKLGFADAEETAKGASMVKKRYEEIINDNPKGVMISSCCPVINNLIKKYYPEVLCHLAPIMTPMEAHCSYIKKNNPNAKTCFIGPCIAKKQEADENSVTDYAITFDDLNRWFESKQVFPNIDEEDDENKGRSRLFPIPGGIIASMDKHPEHVYVSVDGMRNCTRAVKDIAEGKISGCFIEMSACYGGCVRGPVMGDVRRSIVSDNIAVHNYAAKDDFDISQPSGKELTHEYKAEPVSRISVNEALIKKALAKIGKFKPEDELNCGSCGYPTCREKASAVCLGKAEPYMCLVYLMKKAESFSDVIMQNTPNGIIAINDNLEIQQMNNAACKMLNVVRADDVRTTPIVNFLDPLPFIDAIYNGNETRGQVMYLAEYNKYVDVSVVYDKNIKIAIGILRDITEERNAIERKNKERRRTREAADKVIDKQMRVAQQIASLLGETVAETKVVLTSIKEDISDE